MKIMHDSIIEPLAWCLNHSKLTINTRTCFGYISGKCEDCSSHRNFQKKMGYGDLRIRGGEKGRRGAQVWCYPWVSQQNPACHSIIPSLWPEDAEENGWEGASAVTFSSRAQSPQDFAQDMGGQGRVEGSYSISSQEGRRRYIMA